MDLDQENVREPAGSDAKIKRALRWLPTLFIVYRFVVAPLLFLAARDGLTGLFLIGFTLAGASDLFDGVIARRLNIVSQGLHEWDGRADVWFYAWIAAAVWVAYPEVLAEYRVGLLLVIALQVLAWIVDLIKFRRFSNYHAFTSKMLGVSLFAAILALFAFGDPGILMWVVIVTGIISMLDEIAITLILPHWTFDVWSVREALRIRAKETHDAIR